MSDFQIALSDLDYGIEEESAVLRVLKSKWLTMGPEVEAFEREFAAFLGVKHAFAVANATTALQLALLALGLQEGDEVIQPALNFVASANMTVALRAVPVFADVLSLTEPTISPEHVERLISSRTKAVIAMHYGGYLCRMKELTELCQRHGLALIEDACHAPGAAYRYSDGGTKKACMAGSVGDAGAFSFFGNKNLATGEGGMVVTNRDEVAKQLRLLRSHGMTTLTWDRHRGHASSYNVVAHGYNYRLDELHAALGREQLKKLPNGNKKREKLVHLYRELLADLSDWLIPFADYLGESAYHLMVMVAPSEEARNEVVQRLREYRVQTSLHYPCISDFEAFAHWRSEGVPITRTFAMRAITLPLHPGLTEEQVKQVCAGVRGGNWL